MYKKLAKVKSELEAISKDSTNPFFKSAYFDINQLIKHVEPLLQKNGLVLLQPIKNGLVISEIHDVDSDAVISSELELPKLDDPQKLGSCITYYRRYTLQSLLALQAEDDDGNHASKKPLNQQSTTIPPTQLPDKWLNPTTKEGESTREWRNVVVAISKGELTSVNEVRKHYKVGKETEAKLLIELKNA